MQNPAKFREYAEQCKRLAQTAGSAEDLRAVAEYVAGLETEIRRLRSVVDGVDYELSKALDGRRRRTTVRRLRRVKNRVGVDCNA